MVEAAILFFLVLVLKYQGVLGLVTSNFEALLLASHYHLLLHNAKIDKLQLTHRHRTSSKSNFRYYSVIVQFKRGMTRNTAVLEAAVIFSMHHKQRFVSNGML